MKLFFLSDIHGSFYYLKKAAEKFSAEKADFLIILGDELYHGARNPLPPEYSPKDCTELLNGFADKIIAVRGNCESEVDQMVLTYPILSDYSVVLYENKRLFLTHGHIFGEANLPPLRAGDAFFYGHTHIPVAKKQGGISILNPGSITFPKENTPHSYGVLENGIFTIKTLDGEIYRELTL